jgi:hypothetical protein
MDGIVGCGTGRAPDESRRRFDDDDAVDRGGAREMVLAHEGVFEAHGGAAVVADGDRRCGGSCVGAVEAVHVSSSCSR